MKAVVYDRYGPPDVLRVEEVERPEPKDDELLIRIHAATVNRTDCGWRAADPFITRAFLGLRRPRNRILGSELAGVVDAVGSSVEEFAVGDRVFGISYFGGHAEFSCERECAPFAHIPAGMTFEDAAAACDGGIIAMSCLRKAQPLKGRSILIYGASGSIGTAAVQLTKHFEADVTAVCNTKNVELVRSLGADEVIDYTREDFTKNRKTYDVVFDSVGKQSFRRCRRSLKPGGLYIETDLGFMWHVPLLALLTKLIGSKKVTLGIAKYTKEDVVFLKGLIEAGEYRPVIDRRYALEDVVEAARYVETGQKTGNVVLTVRPPVEAAGPRDAL
jgi:NADPH:quinone reductase-like Zn-dependent oxidoreductase